MVMRPRLLGIGGAHVDRRGRVIGDHVPGASNPGTMREEVGGGTLNALRNAVQRGVDAALISVRGGDQPGEMVARALAEAAIEDLSATFLDRVTPTYTALLDGHGDLIAGLADMNLYEQTFARIVSRKHVREAIAEAGAILIDANMPAAAAGFVVAHAASPVCAIAISPAKVGRLAGLLPGLACLFVNRREAERLTGCADPLEAAGWLRAAGLVSAVLSSGAEAVMAYDEDGLFKLRPPEVQAVADVTGAGDALAGATIAALMQGRPLRRALREGMAAAALTIQAPTTVARLGREPFEAMLALVGEPVPVS